MFNAAGYMIPKWTPGNVNPGAIGTDGTSWTSFMGPASQRSRHKMKCIPLIARRRWRSLVPRTQALPFAHPGVPLLGAFSAADTVSAATRLAGQISRLTYICGISISGLGSTAGGQVSATVATLANSTTLIYSYVFAALATTANTPGVLHAQLLCTSRGGISSSGRPARQTQPYAIKMLEFEFPTGTAVELTRFLAECSPKTPLIYPVHVTTRKSFGLMTRKLSVTESQNSAQLRGTFSHRKLSAASANWAQVS
jgi:hypothetical protein